MTKPSEKRKLSEISCINMICSRDEHKYCLKYDFRQQVVLCQATVQAQSSYHYGQTRLLHFREEVFFQEEGVFCISCITILSVHINFISLGLYFRLDSCLLMSEFTVNLKFKQLKRKKKMEFNRAKKQNNFIFKRLMQPSILFVK